MHRAISCARPVGRLVMRSQGSVRSLCAPSGSGDSSASAEGSKSAEYKRPEHVQKWKDEMAAKSKTHNKDYGFYINHAPQREETVLDSEFMASYEQLDKSSEDRPFTSDVHPYNVDSLRQLPKKWFNFVKQCIKNGPIDTLKWHTMMSNAQYGDQVGTLMGTDEFGNRYFENPDLLGGRTRWVEYAEHKKNPDSSQLPPAWHGWIHHKTDVSPGHPDFPEAPAWQAQHYRNMTNTDDAYFPPETDAAKTNRYSGWDKETS